MDWTGIPFEALREGGFALACFVVIYMILTDRLVTKGRLQEERADKKEVMAANSALIDAVREQGHQIEKLLEFAKAGDASMQTLLQTLRTERGAGS